MNPYSSYSNSGPLRRPLGGTINSNSLGSKISESQVSPDGMPCKFELLMEFFSVFLFTFILYFCVFYFIPYDDYIDKILDLFETTKEKFEKFLYKLIPKPVKKAASKLFPKSVVKFFKEQLPKLLRKKRDELTTPLKKKLKKIKDDADKKINKQRKDAKKKKDIFSKVFTYLNVKYLKAKLKITEMWEEFKDKYIPALIIAFIYYTVWFIIFIIIPPVLKYLINIALKFK